MKKRYQVFVSSTFLDLQDERQEVMQALLELNCIPAGMELFPAGNEDQWTLIKNVIDDCDYYLVIIGGRYGSLGPAGLSYTEMEYRYALERDKPAVAFLHKDPGMLPANRTEPSLDGQAKLTAFRSLAQQKMVRFWKSPADLGSVVSRSLMHLILNVPATGWVRADQVTAQATLPSDGFRKDFPADSFKWERTGNLYWLGHDLMWTVMVLLHDESRESALKGLRQTYHHLCEIGMEASVYARQVSRWLKETATTDDEGWTTERRHRLAAAVDRLSDQVAALAETYQHSFRAGPED